MIEYNTTCNVNGTNILCDLKYDKANPAEVSFTFHVNENSPEWVFSRDLLGEVMSSRGKAGQGDVLLYDHGDAVSLLLRSPEGKGLAIFQREVIKEFVDEMYNEVPKNDDVLPLDDDSLQEWLEGLV
ncbi:hypothetical protein SEA_SPARKLEGODDESS_212 [Streptomyces phage SparkleGoddess]|uniref:Sporulation and cell division protein SsgA n=2 Tax=Gilsonvirus comrade TaxID=2846395 RepID=A0A345MEB0_9CAUD|nr:hypothetical protein SEA_SPARKLEGODDESS_212 [Streptomyces phage SparkleGoddess]QQO39865.1 hypothetical protein SEA_BELFORT_212 [Streptomyces phage Belfort]QZE11774.1 hypothetical protein SEA_KARP_208 [Streptomyces phage Karp]UTN92435.1 hypothetical protein SEA_STIGMA_211 [Streptomyces phage Stigma]